jgi:glyoxylase-like metal-dependent hydrolase (beta-lactamase superfamily II)
VRLVSGGDGVIVVYATSFSGFYPDPHPHRDSSICYYVTSSTDADPTAAGNTSGVLFSGDTLFCGGVGAFFEGTNKDMLAIFQRLSVLPPDTDVYPGHDYALNFLKSAVKRASADAAVAAEYAWAMECKTAGRPAVPSTLARERASNLYWRCLTEPAVVGALYPGQWVAGQDNAEKALDLVYNSVWED